MDFIDLKSRHKLISEDIDKRMRGVMEHGRFILGPEVSELEEVLADYVRDQALRDCFKWNRFPPYCLDGTECGSG